MLTLHSHLVWNHLILQRQEAQVLTYTHDRAQDFGPKRDFDDRLMFFDDGSELFLEDSVMPKRIKPTFYGLYHSKYHMLRARSYF